MSAAPVRRELSGAPSLRVELGIALFVLACFLIVGTIDYRVEAAIAAERAANNLRPTGREPAPLYSRNCERRGMDTAFTKTDGGPWKPHCVARRVLTVSAE